MIDAGYKGWIYPINPSSKEILKHKVYPSVLVVERNIDLAIIVVPKEAVFPVLEECGKKGIRHVVVISSGFAEVGDYRAEEGLKTIAKKYHLKIIGPNCLGVLVPKKRLDMIFLPRSRFQRPSPGTISFISQSGAVGSCFLDLMARERTGIAKFISYGNAAGVNEIDLMEALAEDPETKVICMYIEGLSDGRRFLEVAKQVTKKKPVIVLKGGMSAFGAKAVASHTAALAGSGEIFKGAFKQAGVILAETLEELYDYARLFAKAKAPRGSRVQIITNGGGYGIMCADALHKSGLRLASPSAKTVSVLKKSLPSIAIVKNPIDLTGGATTEDYEKTIAAALADNNNDALAIIMLLQTPLVTPDIVDVLTKFHKEAKKPFVVISAGGNFTEIHRQELEARGIPTYTFPENAMKAVKALCDYYQRI